MDTTTCFECKGQGKTCRHGNGPREGRGCWMAEWHPGLRCEFTVDCRACGGLGYLGCAACGEPVSEEEFQRLGVHEALCPGCQEPTEPGRVFAADWGEEPTVVDTRPLVSAEFDGPVPVRGEPMFDDDRETRELCAVEVLR